MDELAAPTDPSRARRLLSGHRVIWTLIGLAATVVLVVALLALVSSRATQTPRGPVNGIDWQPATDVPTGGWDFGPFVATAGGRLFMVGQGGSTTVWSSSDGKTWNRESEIGSFQVGGSGFFSLGLSDDGNGGLVVVGNSLAENDLQPAVVWHSSDGRTWTREPISSDPAEVLGVAARPGEVVAIGQLRTNTSVIDGQVTSDLELAAWSSADGVTWSQAVLPDSADYLPRAITAWKGGFAAVAQNESIGATGSTVWTSTDARTWEKAPTELTDFGASALAALGDRVVVVGYGAQISAESWSSTDGRTWLKSVAPARDPATGFGAVALVGGTLVGAGVSNQAIPASTPRPGWTPPPPPQATIWISADGLTWRLLAADPSAAFSDWHETHITNFGGRVVVATAGAGAIKVLVGDLVP